MGEAGLAGLSDILKFEITDGGPCGRHRQSRLVCCKARIFSFANMLSVKISIL